MVHYAGFTVCKGIRFFDGTQPMTTPFRSVAFRQLWFSTVAATIAQGIERTITSWLILEIGAGAFGIGLTLAARMLPSLLFGITAGTIADRADRPRQLLVVALASALLMICFGWLVAATEPQVWQIVALAFVAGCVHVFDTPARQALVLDTIPHDVAQRGLALNALAGRFASAFGSIAGGFLIVQFGLAMGYIVAAGVYGSMAVLVGTLHVAQAHRDHPTALPFREAFIGSLRMIRDLPVLRTLIVVGMVCEIFAFSHSTALPLFAQEILAAGPTGLGTLNAALSIGGAIAVTLLTLLPERMPREPLLGAVYVVYGLAIVALAATRDLALAVAVALVIGCCAAAFDVLQQTLIQLAVPADQRGRAVGLWVLSIGSAPIGHLEMGAMAATFGVATAIAINGLCTLVGAAWLLVRSPEYRWRA
jgi:MFS family permease